MILINENKIRVGAFGNNTEKILISILGMHTEQRQNKDQKLDNILCFNLGAINFDKIIEGIHEEGKIELLDRIREVFLPEDYEINLISAEKLLVKKIVSELNLKEGFDFKHISGYKWLHEDMPVRITIPSMIIPDNSDLVGLIDHVKGLINDKKAFKYKTDVSFIFYFKEIQPEHLKILEHEEIINSILIENK